MEAVLPAEIACGTRGSGSFLASIHHFMQAFGSSTSALSAEERRLNDLFVRAAAEIGAPLLDAASKDDLGRRVGAALENPRLEAWLSEIAAEAWQMLEHLAPPEAASEPPPFVSVLGEGTIGLLREGERLMLGTVDVLRQISDVVRVMGGAIAFPSVAAEHDHLAFLSDPAVPHEVASAILGSMESNVCLLAILHASNTRRPLDAWLAWGIAERWVGGQRRYLALLASMPGVRVGHDLIRAEERLDLAQLSREAEETRAAFGRFMAAADVAGSDVYAPEPRR